MFDITRKSMEWGGRTLSLESGKVARQADGAVMARYGDTVVLATVVGAKKPKEGVDFFPLTVNYQENTTQLAAFLVAFSSVKVVRRKRKRWLAVLLTAPSVLCSWMVTRTKRKLL